MHGYIWYFDFFVKTPQKTAHSYFVLGIWKSSGLEKKFILVSLVIFWG